MVYHRNWITKNAYNKNKILSYINRLLNGLRINKCIKKAVGGMRLNRLIEYIKSDLYRYTEDTNLLSFIKTYIFRGSFRYIFWVRINSAVVHSTLFKYTLFPITWLIWSRYSYKYGISIPYKTKIGYGLKVNHFSGIIINSNSTIGDNVTICQGVTIGNNEIMNDVKSPIIQDCVYIAPGAKIIGNIVIGDNAIVGANSVVVKDIPSKKIVGGIPAKIIKDNPRDDVKNQYKCVSLKNIS